MDRHLQTALDAVYTMRFADAEAAVQLAIAADPEHPFGYFGMAVVSMIQYVYGTEQSDPKLLTDFDRRLDLAIDRAQTWTDKHPQDTDGYMALGAAYGMSARLMIFRHQWLKAYWRGRKGVAYLNRALKLDPASLDPYSGLGMYDYYSDTYSRFVRVFAKLVLRGDRKRGVAELRRAAAGGRYSQVLAKLILMEVFVEDAYGMRDPEEAARLIAEVQARYPNSAMIEAIGLVASYEGKRFPQLLKDVAGFKAKAQNGEYDTVQLVKGYVIEGTALWAMNRRNEALSVLKTAAETRVGGQPTRWSVWARIRAGQILDLMGERAAAVDEYRAAAELPDLWNLRQYAEDGLHRRWNSAYPGPIAPL
jgi:tetratricopeptide (TPR) repeat protein